MPPTMIEELTRPHADCASALSPIRPTDSESGRARFSRWLEMKFEPSVWLPLLAKGATGVALMGVLAAVGSWSASQPEGVPLAIANVSSDSSNPWLKGERAEVFSHQGSGASLKSSGSSGNKPTEIAGNASTATALEPQATAQTGLTTDGKVILNLASAEEFRKLPGIGKKRALAIVKLRERLKRFRRASDLLRVRGIGPKSFKKMLPHLVLDRPSTDVSGP